MANIVKLGKRPKTFAAIEVPVTLPDGTDAVIPVTFKYKTKPEFGAWQDAVLKEGGKKMGDGEFSWERFYADAGERSAEILLDIIEAWGLDVPLSKDAILELEADCGAGAIPAMFEFFGKACREGRLGN